MATAFIEEDVNHIVSDLLKKPFSVRQTEEQNIIVKQRPTPDLIQATTTNRSFQQGWRYSKKDWLCGLVVDLIKFWYVYHFMPAKQVTTCTRRDVIRRDFVHLNMSQTGMSIV